MRNWRELAAALAIVAAAVGPDFAAGRDAAAFYAQMAGTSWLGVAFAAALFGGVTALVARLARKCSARNMFALLRRNPGGALGWIGCALYAAILLLAGSSLIDAAGRLGALALPLRHAEQFAVAAALLLSAWFALGGGGGLRLVGAAFVAMFALYELALVCFARLDELPGVMFVLEMKLANSVPGTLFFGALHACMCACLSAGVALRAAGEGLRPARLGLWSGGIFLLLSLLGNAALREQMGEILALEVPFVALSACWGKAGFWSSAIVIYLACVTSLSGLLAGLLPERWMLNSKISRPSH